jgi:ureidoglycolate hydrolase
VIGNPNYLKLPNCTLVDFLKKQILLHHPFSSKSFPPFRQETKKFLVNITVEETKVGMNLL